MIQTKYNPLKEQGYCSVFADFNGYKGNDGQGIPNNTQDINWNGKLVSIYIQANDLTLINRDETRF